MGETFNLQGDATSLRALLARAQHLDPQAVARFRTLSDTSTDIFVTTPFGVLAARRVQGAASRDGAVVPVSSLFDALSTHETPSTLQLGTSVDASWPGALPPSSGFVELDILPVQVVRDLADKGQELAREFSGPMVPPARLLDQAVVTVTSETGEAADIPMRMIFACTSLGLIPGIATHANLPRHLRVSKAGRWVRIDAPFGSVYFTKQGLPLF